MCDSSKRLRIPLSRARDKTKTNFSPFLYRAQNLPSFLFYIFFVVKLKMLSFFLDVMRWTIPRENMRPYFPQNFKLYEVNLQISLTQNIAVIIII